MLGIGMDLAPPVVRLLCNMLDYQNWYSEEELSTRSVLLED